MSEDRKPGVQVFDEFLTQLGEDVAAYVRTVCHTIVLTVPKAIIHCQVGTAARAIVPPLHGVVHRCRVLQYSQVSKHGTSLVLRSHSLTALPFAPECQALICILGWWRGSLTPSYSACSCLLYSDLNAGWITCCEGKPTSCDLRRGRSSAEAYSQMCELIPDNTLLTCTLLCQQQPLHRPSMPLMHSSLVMSIPDALTLRPRQVAPLPCGPQGHSLQLSVLQSWGPGAELAVPLACWTPLKV